MKIVFYANHVFWGGLANNGGTRTILRSAATLTQLGHTTAVVAHKDRFTWFPHPRPVAQIPRDADVIVAVSVSDMDSLMRHYIGDSKVVYWARPYETWQMPMQDIVRNMREVLKRGGAVLCNSSWQVDELRNKYNIDAKLAYAGLDFDWYYGEPSVRIRNRIGCLYSKVACKRWVDFVRLRKLLGNAFEYVAFGQNNHPDGLTVYQKNPSHDSLQRLYQSCAMFYCPNSREGFYNCGYEAAMCGSILITSDYHCNGMGDYATPETAHVVHTVEQAADAARNLDVSKDERMRSRLIEIGDRKTNMERFVTLL